jgi:ABC-type multidrug transport system ATPase subunit
MMLGLIKHRCTVLCNGKKYENEDNKIKNIRKNEILFLHRSELPKKLTVLKENLKVYGRMYGGSNFTRQNFKMLMKEPKFVRI